MRFILVDTADARGSVAVFENADEIWIEAHSSEEDYSSWLLPAAHRALAACSISLSQLDGYAVCAGPGSFTGLRVGLTTIKAWAEIYGQPIAAVSRLEALTLSQPFVTEPFIATFMDARRDQVFAGFYERMGDCFAIRGDESVIALPEFIGRVAAESAGRSVYWLSPDIDMLVSAPEWRVLQDSGHVLQRVKAPFATELGRLAFQSFGRGETKDAMSLDANYVRRSDAEIFRKGNKPALKP
jgi:tRNA threonylcarbamoyladenosine biosynthesis protein TsaB